MSNSKLVSYTKLSPYCNKPRNHKIDTITIHHVAGNATVEALGREFTKPNRNGSSNYGVGSDGRIGLYVDEANRAWTSGSGANDHRAVTIEVANDGGAPDWHVSDKALKATIDLCVDICKRNGIQRLNYTGDKTGNLTMHKWFQATLCPGPYLSSKFPYIAQEVNKRLRVITSPPSDEIYRIRKSWADAASQVGAYRNLESAKRICPAGFTVYNSKGEAIYKEPFTKTPLEIAKEVIQGKWGIGAERKRRLTEAGYDYAAIQKLVNTLLR